MENVNSFDVIMENCPFLKGIIENKISDEVAKAKAERDVEVNDLKAQNAQILMSLVQGGLI